MSFRTMTKRCIHCHRVYTYNPSVEDLGTVCKLCGRAQLPVLATDKPPKVWSPILRFPGKPGKPL